MAQPTAFGAAFQISTQNVNAQDLSALAVLRNGSVAVVWRDMGANAGDIKLQIVQSDGTARGGESTVSTVTPGQQTAPSVAALTGGGFVVGWTSFASDASGDVAYRSFTANGTATMANDGGLTNAVGYQQDISVVGLNGNRFALGWNEGNTATSGLGNSTAAMLQQFDATGALSPALRLSGNWGGDYGPRLVFDGTHLLAAWDDSSGPSTAQNGEDGIYSRLLTLPLPGSNFTDGGTRMDTGTFREASFDPDVALTSAGSAVVWDDVTTGTDARDIFLSLNGSVTRVNTTTQGDQAEAAITSLAGGGFVVVWTDRNTLGGSDIRARAFDAAGNATSADFLVTDPGAPSSGVQFNPDVAGLQDGRFMVSWSDAANGHGIDGRIFDPRSAAIVFDGGPDGELVFGTTFAQGDTLAGGGGNDTLNAMAGDDILQAGPGHNMLDGGKGRDVADYADSLVSVDITLSGSQFAVATLGGVATDRLRNIETVWGGTKDDHLAGDGTANTLLGHGGRDLLAGGLGIDTLTGGAQADTFLFTTAPATGNRDEITDFTSGLDHIALKATRLAALGPTLDPGEFVNGPAFDLNDHLIYDAAKRILSWDADGSNAGKAVAILHLQAGATLTFADLQLA